VPQNNKKLNKLQALACLRRRSSGETIKRLSHRKTNNQNNFHIRVLPKRHLVKYNVKLQLFGTSTFISYIKNSECLQLFQSKWSLSLESQKLRDFHIRNKEPFSCKSSFPFHANNCL